MMGMCFLEVRMLRRNLLILSAFLVAGACGGDDVTNPPGAGTLDGRVTGPGGPIPEAQVVITGGATQETDDEGRYTFNNVAAGQQTVTVTPPSGFVLASGETAAKSVTVTEGATASVDWSVRLSDTAPRTVEVGLSASSFNSADVTVPVGSTIKWENQAAITHTISPSIPTQVGTWVDVTVTADGEVFDHTFGTAGTFDYICKLHSGMAGVIRVH